MDLFGRAERISLVVLAVLAAGGGACQAELAAAERDAITPGEVLFEDAFDRDELGADWRMLDESTDHRVVDKGVLIVTKPYGEKTDPETGKKTLVYVNTLDMIRALPDDAQITVEWEIGFAYDDKKRSGQHIELVLQGENASLIVGMENNSHGGGPFIRRYFDKVIRGSRNRITHDEEMMTPPPVGWGQNEIHRARLRLVRKKYTVIAYAQRTGQEWTKIGTHKLISLKSPVLQLRQYTDPVRYGTIPEVEARIKEVTVETVD